MEINIKVEVKMKKKKMMSQHPNLFDRTLVVLDAHLIVAHIWDVNNFVICNYFQILHFFCLFNFNLCYN